MPALYVSIEEKFIRGASPPKGAYGQGCEMCALKEKENKTGGFATCHKHSQKKEYK